jgi:hypothetical protein
MTPKVDLKNYVCGVPFSSIELHDHKRFLCCASWLKKYLPEDVSAKEAWESTEANDVRDSVLDGSFKYCDKMHCPFLNQLEIFGEKGRTTPIFHKDKLPHSLKKTIDNYKEGNLESPQIAQFSMDRSCNLKCPSCRLDIFIADGKKIKKVKEDIELIEKQYGNDITVLYITGSGDPFISVAFRNFLRTFDSTKWPKLESIHLHTNATKWNKEMWDSMSNIHKYVKSCEISVDAATKDTYENKTRLGGNWEELINNLKFISTIPDLKRVKTSFVVQQKNYKEMKQFNTLMNEIFGEKTEVFFGKITNWGTFSDDEYVEQQIWDKNHKEYDNFIKEVNSVLPFNKGWHNLQEFILPKSRLI